MTEPPLTRLQRIILRVRGKVFIAHRKLLGWSGSLPFYAVNCKKHGVYMDYPHGYRGYFVCPKCRREVTKDSEFLSRGFEGYMSNHQVGVASTLRPSKAGLHKKVGSRTLGVTVRPVNSNGRGVLTFSFSSKRKKPDGEKKCA